MNEADRHAKLQELYDLAGRAPARGGVSVGGCVYYRPSRTWAACVTCRARPGGPERRLGLLLRGHPPAPACSRTRSARRDTGGGSAPQLLSQTGEPLTRIPVRRRVMRLHPGEDDESRSRSHTGADLQADEVVFSLCYSGDRAALGVVSSVE